MSTCVNNSTWCLQKLNKETFSWYFVASIWTKCFAFFNSLSVTIILFQMCAITVNDAWLLHEVPSTVWVVLAWYLLQLFAAFNTYFDWAMDVFVCALVRFVTGCFIIIHVADRVLIAFVGRCGFALNDDLEILSVFFFVSTFSRNFTWCLIKIGLTELILLALVKWQSFALFNLVFISPVIIFMCASSIIKRWQLFKVQHAISWIVFTLLFVQTTA